MRRLSILIFSFFNILLFTACSDMLETESEQQLFDPELSDKTDSLFYAFGIMQAMQEVADQYVFQGELRGDVAQVTEQADSALSNMAKFKYDAATRNKYDSAYAYYRVINNCNYYIAHRNLDLYSGSTNVVMAEYVAVKAFRAWAYLQLARNYKEVPFFLEPMTSISQIEDNSNYELLDIKQIAARLEADLLPHAGTATPLPGGGNWPVSGKTVQLKYCYIPVDVVLGDLYLEAGEYTKAADSYTRYLVNTGQMALSLVATYKLLKFYDETGEPIRYPDDFASIVVSSTSWQNMFNTNNVTDLVTYIPMATSSQRGATTIIPLTFGFNYYSTSSGNSRYTDDIQVVPSQPYLTLTNNTDYYYYQATTGADREQFVGAMKHGDMRYNNTVRTQDEEGDDDSGTQTKIWMTKYNNNANIILYRLSTVYLHLAEAYNRMGYPDLAFAILKEGITNRLIDLNSSYITDETKELLTKPNSFLSEENISKFTPTPKIDGSPNTSVYYGIHQHGAGVTADGNYPGRSPYQFADIVGAKMAELAATFTDITVGATKQDSINAMEDVLCDEYALELAFEGTRYYDLCRMARHKNETPALYGANFGSRWLANKLAFKNPVVNLLDENNWYLPALSK